MITKAACLLLPDGEVLLRQDLRMRSALLLMHFASSAPGSADGSEVYAMIFLHGFCTTSGRRAPLPIIPLAPTDIMVGAYASIRPLVVGPADPMTWPGFAGVGPYVVNRSVCRIKRDFSPPCERFTHSLMSGVTGSIDSSGQIYGISGMQCFASSSVKGSWKYVFP